MLDRKIGTAEFERSSLGTLLQGREPDRITSFAEWIGQAAYSGRVTAVWTLDQSGNHGFLPNLLVGSDSVISDLLAWSSAFLPGSGPLSGIMRVLSTTDLKFLLEDRQPIELRAETLAPLIAICFGELLAQRRESANEQRLSVQALTNTLSYGLFRARLVAPHLERKEIIRRWKFVQGNHIVQRHDRIISLVTELTDGALHRLRSYDVRHGKSAYRPHLDIEASTLSISRLRQFLPESTRQLVPEAFWNESERLSAEQLVDLLDEMSPALQRGTDGSASERARLIASLISRTNPEIGNQLELARPMLESLPEIGLWLTVGLAEQAPGKLLSANMGVGWKLAARLTSLFDPLASPTADVAWQEMQLGSTSVDTATKKLGDFRQVEIYPGHSVSRPQAQASTHAEGAARPARRRGVRANAYSSQEVLARAEQNLEEALHAVQSVLRERY